MASEPNIVTRESVSLPRRKADTHKGDYGKVLIVGGCVGYTGAPNLAAAAAVKGKAGQTGMAPDEAIPVFVRLFSWLLRAFDVFSDQKPEIRTASTNASGLRITCI